MPRAPSHKLSLLRTHAPFRRLFVATTCSAVGTYLAALALSVDIYDRTGSGKWLAALLVADFLPIVVVGLALGPLIDRLQRRRLMIVADLVRLGVFAALPFVDSPKGIVALAAVIGVATGFFRPAVWAGVPNLVGDDKLDEATSLLSTMENVAWMVGPIATGALLTIADPSAAYWLNAASFLVSAFLISRLRAHDLQSATKLTRGHWRDVKDGFAVVRRSVPLVTVILVWNTASFGNAAINVAEVVFAKSELGVGNIGLGILVGATGLGLVIGSFISSWVIGRFGMAHLYGGSLMLMGIAWSSASFSPTIYVAIPLIVLACVGNGIALVCNQLLVQRGTDDATRGRAVALIMSSYYLVLPAGMALAGWLTDAAGARTSWAIGGGFHVLAAMVAFARLGTVSHAVQQGQAASETTTAGEARDGRRAEQGGLDRINALLTEIAETRATEARTHRMRYRVLRYATRERRDAADEDT